MRLEEGGEREKEGDSWDGVRGKERRRQEKIECKKAEKNRCHQCDPWERGGGEMEDRRMASGLESLGLTR